MKTNLPVGKFAGEPTPVFYSKEVTAISIIIEMGIDTKIARYKIDKNTAIRVDFTPTFVCDNMDEPGKIAGEEIKIAVEYKEPLVV